MFLIRKAGKLVNTLKRLKYSFKNIILRKFSFYFQYSSSTCPDLTSGRLSSWKDIDSRRCVLPKCSVPPSATSRGTTTSSSPLTPSAVPHGPFTPWVSYFAKESHLARTSISSSWGLSLKWLVSSTEFLTLRRLEITFLWLDNHEGNGINLGGMSSAL